MSSLECLYMQPTITVDFEQKIFIKGDSTSPVFFICPRLLIKYGMKDLLLNLSQWASQMHY